MSGLPQTTIVGTLTGDPEIRMLPSGVAIVTVNIAANERKYNKDSGKYEDGEATFLRGTIWRDYAEHVAESLNRGDKVIAIGRLRQKSWEKDGVKRTGFELDIEEIGPTLRFVTANVNRKSGSPVAAVASSAWGGGNDEPAW